jgi:type IV pilus assembly protein PilN
MRIGINLATRPYQDEARFYRLWGTAVALMVLLTGLLVYLSIKHYRDSRDEWASARRAEAKLAAVKREEAQAQQILAQPGNRGTRDRSYFLNTAILRKSFSWTRLMEDMEKIMPAGLRVVSIAPVIDQHNRFVLKLQVQGERRDTAVQLLRNMERSPHFRSSQLNTEAHSQSKNGEGGVKSEIKTAYVPAEALEGGE